MTILQPAYADLNGNGDALLPPNSYPVRFPKAVSDEFEQNTEWCEVYIDNAWQRIRLHDYAGIYRQPGLYEYLFANLLRCSSPQRVVSLLGTTLREWDHRATDLSVIDLGAGNGMVGEQLRLLGIRALVGADIIPEAAEAARRDRPRLYDDYVVADLCELRAADAERLRARQPNCLTTVSALGFGDIPPRAFGTAFNLISTPGWLAFNIKETFLSGKDETGFSRLIRALSDGEFIQIQAYSRYSHRLSVDSQRLNYVAMVARKLRPMPENMPSEVE
jgi:hypothetical protein